MVVFDSAGNPIDLSPKPLPWAAFEEEVAASIELYMQKWYGLQPHIAVVKRRPKYYSMRRQSDIIFDVSIEICPAGSPETPALLWLFECKDYPTRKVEVAEIEEFRCKMEQVDAHKGTVFTRVGFQEGAIELAKSYRIGLMTLQKQEVFAIQFSMDSGLVSHVEVHATFCLYPDGHTGQGNISEFIKVNILRFLESQGMR